jgi:hypothetical protein
VTQATPGQMGTFVRCPLCGTDQLLPAHFTNVTFSGGLTNIAVTCRACGRAFDAASGDGAYSTIVGRLQRVTAGVRILLDESRDDPAHARQLLELLERHRTERTSPSQLADEIGEATAGGYSGFRTWLKENQDLAQWVGAGASVAAFLVMIILAFFDKPSSQAPAGPHVVVNVQTPTDAELEERIREALKASRISTGQPTAPGDSETARRAGRSPARNAPCPCGSGKKYKRCHGAPGRVPSQSDDGS